MQALPEGWKPMYNKKGELEGYLSSDGRLYKETAVGDAAIQALTMENTRLSSLLIEKECQIKDLMESRLACEKTETEVLHPADWGVQSLTMWHYEDAESQDEICGPVHCQRTHHRTEQVRG